MIRDNGPCCKMESPNSRKEVSKKKKNVSSIEIPNFPIPFPEKKMERARANYPGVTNIVDEQCN